MQEKRGFREKEEKILNVKILEYGKRKDFEKKKKNLKCKNSYILSVYYLSYFFIL